MSYFRSQKPALIVLLLVAASVTPALAGASLDIRPSVCPNLVHRYEPGILVAALVSDVDFVISYRDINISSLRLSRADGLGGSVRPIYFRRNFLIDVAAPSASDTCSTFGVDGMVDLRLFFGQVRLVSALDLGDYTGSLDVCLSGRTNEGTEFNACDQITMVGHKIRTLPGTDDGDLSPLP